MTKVLMVILSNRLSPSNVREMQTSTLMVKTTLTESSAIPLVVSLSRRRVCLGARKCANRKYIEI